MARAGWICRCGVQDEAESTCSRSIRPLFVVTTVVNLSSLVAAVHIRVQKGLNTSWESQRPDLHFDSGSYAHQLIVSGRTSAARVQDPAACVQEQLLISCRYASG